MPLNRNFVKWRDPSYQRYLVHSSQNIGVGVISGLKFLFRDDFTNSCGVFSNLANAGSLVKGRSGTSPIYVSAGGPGNGPYISFAENRNALSISVTPLSGLTREITAIMWARMSSAVIAGSRQNGLLHLETPAGEIFRLRKTANASELALSISDATTGSQTMTVSGIGIGGDWAMISATMSSSNGRSQLYINTALSGTSAMYRGWGDTFADARCILGGEASQNSVFSGDLALFRLYNRELSAAEIANHYNSGSGVLFGQIANTSSIKYAVDFTPLVSNRQAYPGPGTLGIIDAGANVLINSGKMISSGSVESAGTDWRMYTSQAFSAEQGMCLAANVSRSAAVPSITVGFNAASSSRPNDAAFDFLFASMRVRTNGVLVDLASPILLQEASLHIVRRASGGAFYIANGDLRYVGSAESSSALFAGIGVGFIGGTESITDFLRVSQLGSPWNEQNGISTSVISSLSATNRFLHESDFVLTFSINTLPSAGGSFVIKFREQNANNHWYLSINNGASGELHEVVSGVDTLRSSFVGISGGSQNHLIADGEYISFIAGSANKIGYSGATNFKTEASGVIPSISGASITGFIVWPRHIVGAAKHKLDKMLV